MLANSPTNNLIDYFLHEISLVWGIVLVFAVIGLLLGRFLTRKGRRDFKRYSRENRILLDQYRALREKPEFHRSRPQSDSVTHS